MGFSNTVLSPRLGPRNINALTSTELRAVGAADPDQNENASTMQMIEA
jgi:hypothetical protein